MQRNPSRVVGVRSGGRYIEDDEDIEEQAAISEPASEETATETFATPNTYSYMANYAAVNYGITDGEENTLTMSNGAASERNELWWNNSYQKIVSMKASAEKYKQLQRLASDFSYVAEQYGSVIINFCSGVMFKFANDVEIQNGRWIYGNTARNDFLAMKSANHDIKGCVAIMQANIPNLCTSLMSVIDYRGYRLCAQSFLPISDSTLRYGSNDGGVLIHNSDAELSVKIQDLAHRLNIKRHTVHSRKDDKHKEIYGPFDLEGHRSIDGRFYVIDLSRLYPPEAILNDSNLDSRNQILALRLRPEFCAKYHRPLSSDGFSRVESATLTESNEEIRAATRHLYDKVIPDFAAFLDRENISHESLKREIHRAGINMRHMGRILRLVQSFSARCLILTDMVMRSIKYIIRKEWRDASENMTFSSRDIFHEILSRKLNSVFYFGADSDYESFWESPELQLRCVLKEKFGVVASDLVNDENRTLLGQINLLVLFKKLRDALGFVLSDRAIASHQADIRSGLYAFLAEDVERLQPVCKHTHLVSMAGGVSLYFKAKHRFDRQGDALLSLALDLLQQAHSAAPFDKEVIFYLAKTYHAMLRRSLSSSSTLESAIIRLTTKSLEYYQDAMTAGWDAARCYKNKFRVCLTAAKLTRREDYFQLCASLLTEFCDTMEKSSEVTSFLGRLISNKPEYAAGPGLINLLQLARLSGTFAAVLIPLLHRIDIRGAAFATSAMLSNLFTGSSPWQLTEISLGHSAQLDDLSFSTLLNNLQPELVVKLYLNDCWRLSDASLELLADKLTNLRTLNISGCVGFSGNTILSVLTADSSLGTSKLAQLEVIACVGNRQMTFDCLRALFLRPKIRKINCNGISPSGKVLDPGTTILCENLADFACDWRISSVFLRYLITKTPNLKRLQLGSTEDLRDDDLVCLLRELKELVSIDVGTNHLFTDAVLDSLVQHGQNIIVFDINSQLFSRDALLKACASVPRLQSLSFLSRSKFFDEEIFQKLSEISTSISSLSLFKLDDDAKPRITPTKWLPSFLSLAPNLTSIKLDRCKLDEAVACAIFKACSRLQAVSLFNCFYDGSGLHHLVSCNQDLISLQLVNCYISAANLLEMSKFMSSTLAVNRSGGLKTLHILSCRRVTEAAVIAVLKKTPILRKLSLQYANTTDLTLLCLLSDCQYLESVEISSATFTERILTSVFAGLPSLQILTLKDCTGLSRSALARILINPCVYKLDVSSNTFPRVFRNVQFGQILLEQAFVTKHRSEVAALVRECCVRWRQADQLRESFGSFDSIDLFVLDALQTLLLQPKTSIRAVSRALLCFLVEYSKFFDLSPPIKTKATEWIAQHGLILHRLPHSLDAGLFLRLLDALGGRSFLQSIKQIEVFNCMCFLPENLLELAQMTAALDSLHLSSNGESITSSVISAFSMHNSALKTFVARNCLSCIDDGIRTLVKSCGATLQVLDLSVIDGEYEFTFPLRNNLPKPLYLLVPETLHVVAEHCHQLDRLLLRGRDNCVDIDSLSRIVKSNSRLIELDVRQCFNLDPREVVRVLRVTPALQKLKCFGPVDERTFQAILNQPFCTSLTTLHFEELDKQVTPKYVTSVIKAATRLESLSLLASSLENHQFGTVIKFISRWRPSTKKLRLTVRKAGEGDIAGFVKSCTQLSVLHKRAFSCETSEGVLLDLPVRTLTLENAHQMQIGVPSVEFQENIRTFRITNYGGIGALPNTLTSCRNIQRLALLFCQNLTDQILQQICSSLTLKLVELDGSKGLSNASIQYIAESSPNLRALSICFCPKIKNDGLVAVVERLKDLEHLRLLISWITPDQVVRARKSLPFCAIDYLSVEALPLKSLEILGPFDLANVVKQYGDKWR